MCDVFKLSGHRENGPNFGPRSEYLVYNVLLTVKYSRFEVSTFTILPIFDNLECQKQLIVERNGPKAYTGNF